MLSINTSINDLILQRTLLESTFDLNDAINRMTTGFKVNSAKDNAAGFSIIEELNTKISSMLQVQSNTESGVSLLNTAEGGLTEIQELLERLRELTTQAANGTYDSLTREAMQAEADSIVAEISRIKNSIQFDGMNLYETPASQSNNIAANAVARLSNAVVLNANESISHSEALAEESQELGATTSNLGSTSVASLSQGGVMLMSLDDGVATASTTIEGAVYLAVGDTKTITVDGISYEIINRRGVAQDISYIKDIATGQITFIANNLTITGEDGVSHNLVINGSNNFVYGGNKDDTIVTYDESSNYNRFYGNDGNDTLRIDSSNGYIYGNAGDDIITAKGSVVVTFGNGGNDTFYLDYIKLGASSSFGGDGNDTFYISHACYVLGEGGDDNFIINSSASGAIIDGGTGTNTVTDNGTGTLKINVPGENAFVETFDAYETKILTINNIQYTVTNTKDASNTFIVGFNNDGKLNFKTSLFNIVGEENVSHNVHLGTNNLKFTGGKLADNISISANNCMVFANEGDDIIKASGYGYIDAGAGNDDITTTSGGNLIIGGDGNDIVQQGYVSSNILYDNSGLNTITSDNGDYTQIYGFGDADNVQQVIEFDSYETKKITINGIDYTVENPLAEKSVLLYSINDVTGEISFGGYKFYITGDSNKQHNVILYGYNLNFKGGDYDDTVINRSHSGNVMTYNGNDTIQCDKSTGVHGGDGDDIIVVNNNYCSINGNDGNDTLIVNVKNNLGYIYGNNGDDIYEINAVAPVNDASGNNTYYINADGVSVSGSYGSETFYIAGSNNVISASSGDDYFVVDGSNNTLDGGTGNNYYIDNGTGNSYTNVIKDPNSGAIVFSYVGEVITKTINGREYSFTNNGIANNTLNYSVNANTDTVTFDGSDLQIKGLENQSHILAIRGSNNIVNGGNLNDKITIESGSNNTINANGGNDTIINDSENNAINGGDGNDTISLNKSTNLAVNSGNGADTINIASSNNTQVNAGSGDDKIVVNGTNNTIKAQDGNNSITVNGDSNTISATTGNNKLVLASDDNTVTLGNGNNIYGISGDSNNVTVQNAVGTVNVMGAGNTVNQTQGVNDVVIKGSGNSYSSTLGSKDVKVTGSGNTIITGTDSDTVELNGDSNSITTAGGNNEITVIGNSNQIQGGNGIDTIKLTGNMNTALGGEENDAFTLVRGYNNTIDGEGGDRNTMVNYSDSITSTNVTDITPRPFELNVKVATGSADSAYISTKIAFNPIFLSVDLSSVENALKSLESIDEVLMSVSEQLLNIGSVINRLEMALNEQNIKLENMISTRSTLRDADIAEESSNYIRYQILQQANVSLLSSSRNLRAENVLGLLQGLRR